jgi:hypothetical protein
MADLRERVGELWRSLSRQVQTSKKPSDVLGDAQRSMLVQLVDEYLQGQEDPTIRAARQSLDPMYVVTVGDAITVLDVMRQRWPDSPLIVSQEEL